MTYTINTTVAPTEGFTGLNMGYERYDLSVNGTTTYFQDPFTLTRMPSGVYLLSCNLNELLAYSAGATTNWYVIADINQAGITSTTFKPVFFNCFFSAVAGAVELRARYNYNASSTIEVTTNDVSDYVGQFASFQIYLIPQ